MYFQVLRFKGILAAKKARRGRGWERFAPAQAGGVIRFGSFPRKGITWGNVAVCSAGWERDGEMGSHLIDGIGRKRHDYYLLAVRDLARNYT